MLILFQCVYIKFPKIYYNNIFFTINKVTFNKIIEQCTSPPEHQNNLKNKYILYVLLNNLSKLLLHCNILMQLTDYYYLLMINYVL